ncbi:myosin heavy chain IB-like [Oenanthe melanoleuca]|uniref:myosin heavy chain IB-like n=1 Tax=Oenanthe melanoleuca TaxID=2939378 RepID=UPI0024C0F5D8|nr:myosin heavy chain IB-like [Oenanthe melanoleuca]
MARGMGGGGPGRMQTGKGGEKDARGEPSPAPPRWCRRSGCWRRARRGGGPGRALSRDGDGAGPRRAGPGRAAPFRRHTAAASWGSPGRSERSRGAYTAGGRGRARGRSAVSRAAGSTVASPGRAAAAPEDGKQCQESRSCRLTPALLPGLSGSLSIMPPLPAVPAGFGKKQGTGCTYLFSKPASSFRSQRGRYILGDPAALLHC